MSLQVFFRVKFLTLYLVIHFEISQLICLLEHWIKLFDNLDNVLLFIHGLTNDFIIFRKYQIFCWVHCVVNIINNFMVSKIPNILLLGVTCLYYASAIIKVWVYFLVQLLAFMTFPPVLHYLFIHELLIYDYVVCYT